MIIKRRIDEYFTSVGFPWAAVQGTSAIALFELKDHAQNFIVWANKHWASAVPITLQPITIEEEPSDDR